MLQALHWENMRGIRIYHRGEMSAGKGREGRGISASQILGPLIHLYFWHLFSFGVIVYRSAYCAGKIATQNDITNAHLIVQTYMVTRYNNVKNYIVVFFVLLALWENQRQQLKQLQRLWRWMHSICEQTCVCVHCSAVHRAVLKPPTPTLRCLPIALIASIINSASS